MMWELPYTRHCPPLDGEFIIAGLILAGGFYIYAASNFESNVRFGLLSESSPRFAFTADFFMVPEVASNRLFPTLNGIIKYAKKLFRFLQFPGNR